MKRRMMLLCMLALVVATAARSDIIELADGRKFSGTLSRSADVITIKSDDGKIIQVKPADIAKVTLTSEGLSDPAAAAWSRTRTRAQAAATLAAVIDLYQKFLDQFPAAPQAEEARTALASYRAMLDQDPVKFHDTWMPRAQISQAAQRGADAARPALDLYTAGQIKSAMDTILPLAADGQNPDALTLAGLASYRLKSYPAAHTYFAKLAAADPASVAAENNLAIVCVAQKQMAEAFVHYTKALQLMPTHRLLIDNVAEALHTYGNSDKNNPAYKALLAAYTPAETKMQDQMGKDKLYRWGASWVTREQMDRLLKSQSDIRTMMTQLDSHYTGFQTRLTQLQAQIKGIDSQLDNDTAIMGSSLALFNQTAQGQGASYQARINAAQKNFENTQLYKTRLQAYYNQLVTGTRDFFDRAEKLKAAATGASAGYFAGTPHLIDWAETDNPPPPVPVPETTVPKMELPDVVLNPPPAPAPPVLLPIPEVAPDEVPPARGR